MGPLNKIRIELSLLVNLAKREGALSKRQPLQVIKTQEGDPFCKAERKALTP
jgi:hypothetical protein